MSEVIKNATEMSKSMRKAVTLNSDVMKAIKPCFNIKQFMEETNKNIDEIRKLGELNMGS